jgi:flagellar hook-associated protein 2
LSTALTAAGVPATGGTTLSALGLGVAANDTITISGTLRSGVSVSGSYTVLDPAVDTISGLLSAIQATFNQEVIASVDANGRITLTDNKTGDSQLSISLTANNEGGGTLSFGSDTIVTEGRYALPVQAVIFGTGIGLESVSYGAGSGFSIAQSVDGLGIADQSVTGTDVAGTINGLTATGSGQMLLGASGDVDGLALLYSGTATGAVGDLTVGVGIAAAFDGLLDTFSNPVAGFIQGSVQSEQTTFDDLTARIDQLTQQMEQQRVVLTGQFTRMQQALASLQQSGDFLTQQINAQNARN